MLLLSKVVNQPYVHIPPRQGTCCWPPYPITDMCSNCHGRVPVVGFSRLIYFGRHMEREESSNRSGQEGPYALCVFGLWLRFSVWFVWFLLSLFVCGMTSYDLAPRGWSCHSTGFTCRISRASKHLHNNLARAIEALEQKNQQTIKPPDKTK